MRTRAFRREVRNKSIKRKKAIVLSRDGSDWYKFDGQYSKGKIFCNCGACKPSRNMGYLLSKMRKSLKLLNLLLMIIIMNIRKGLNLWKRL